MHGANEDDEFYFDNREKYTTLSFVMKNVLTVASKKKKKKKNVLTVIRKTYYPGVVYFFYKKLVCLSTK